ncbi:MAG: WG repeat-containing protein [Cyanobacteria bacterium SZAS TMP-1]|nr:WG repeat-containing protein [Cyanobacteria bacterium SZAS TMP-1]
MLPLLLCFVLLISAPSALGQDLPEQPLTLLPEDRLRNEIIDKTGKPITATQFDNVNNCTDGVIWAVPFKEGKTFKEWQKFKPFDKSGRLLSNWKLANPSQYSDGLMPVEVGGKYQYIDHEGRVAIAQRFDSAGVFYKGLAAVTIDSKLHIIDTRGNSVWSIKDLQLKPTKDRLPVVTVQDHTFLLWITKDGSSSPSFTQWIPDEFTPVREDPLKFLYGYINKQGQRITPQIYSRAEPLSEVLALVTLENQSFYIDAKGKTVLTLPQNIVPISGFHGGRAVVYLKPDQTDLPPSLAGYAETYCALIDKTGKIITNQQFTSLGPAYEDGLFSASVNNNYARRYGFIDKDGTTVIPFKYLMVNDFCEGVSAVCIPSALDEEKAKKPEITVTQYDREIRNRLRKALSGCSLPSCIRVVLRIDSTDKCAISLRKGLGNIRQNQKLQACLSSFQAPPRASAIGDGDLMLEYAIDQKNIYAGGSGKDPFRPIEAKVAELATEYEKNIIKGKMAEAVQLDLVRKIIIGMAAYEDQSSNITNRADNLYHLAKQHSHWADAEIAGRLKYPLDAENFRDAVAQLASEHRRKSSEKEVLLQDIAVEKRRLSNKEVIAPDAICYELNALGDYFYKHRDMSGAERSYRQAADLRNYQVLNEDGKPDQTVMGPYGSVYRLACFLAATGKQEESKKVFDQLLSKLQSLNGTAFSLWPDYDGYQSYLSLLQAKDPDAYKKYGAAIEPFIRGMKRTGLIDKTGKVLMPPTFQDITPFIDGIAAADYLGRWGFIDKTGQWLTTPRYMQAAAYSCGLAPVCSEFALFPPASIKPGTDKWGFVDKMGKYLVKDLPGQCDAMLEGIACIRIYSDPNPIGFIDRRGKVIPGPHLYDLAHFKNGLCKGILATNEPPITGYSQQPADTYPVNLKLIKRNATGRQDSSSSEFEIVFDGLNPKPIKNKDSIKWGYVDPSGVLKIEPQFDAALEFADGLAPVKVDNLWGYIDERGRFAIPPTYNQANSFENGLARVWYKNKNCYIDRTGTIVHDNFHYMWPFKDGVAVFRNEAGTKSGLVDKSRKIIIPAQYDEIRQPSDGMAAYRMADKWGFIDTQGKIIIPAQYLTVSDFSEGVATFQLAN